MKLLIFAKKKQTKEGRDFIVYSTKLHRADGSEQYATVKFREDAGSPKLEECPIYIDVNREDVNRKIENVELVNKETGEISTMENHTVWVKAWQPNPEKYVDTSMDEFVD